MEVSIILQNKDVSLNFSGKFENNYLLDRFLDNLFQLKIYI